MNFVQKELKAIFTIFILNFSIETQAEMYISQTTFLRISVLLKLILDATTYSSKHICFKHNINLFLAHVKSKMDVPIGGQETSR